MAKPATRQPSTSLCGSWRRMSRSLQVPGSALVGVDHEIGRPAVGLLGHERPFEAGREAGAAAPAQAGLLDLVDDRVAALVRAASLVSSQSPRWRAPARRQSCCAVEIGEDAVLVAQHRSTPPRRASSSVVGPPSGAEPWRPFCEPGLRLLAARAAPRAAPRALGVEVLVEVVVDLDHRRVDAGAQALDLGQREHAVGGGLARGRCRACSCRPPSARRSRAASTAWSADLQVIAADRLQVEHGVEGRDLVDADRRHVEQAGDMSIAARGSQPPCCRCAEIEQRQHRARLPARRIVGDDLLRLRQVLRREGEARRLVDGVGRRCSSVDLAEHDVHASR